MGEHVDDQFRLLFRGEVAQGQHAAVVRKRLAKLLKLSDEKVAALFTGNNVVLRRSVDAKTAAQFQAAFKQAGAKLRVQPIASSDEAGAPAAAQAAPVQSDSAEREQESPSDDAVQAQTEYGLRLLPVGSFLLEVHERLPPVEADIAIDHLTLKDNAALAADSDAQTAPAETAVNVDHLSVAEPGAQLGSDPDAQTTPSVEFDFEFELAEDGSWLRENDVDEAAPVVAPDYTLAEPGAPMVEPGVNHAPQPSAPDVSHLSLQDDAADS